MKNNLKTRTDFSCGGLVLDTAANQILMVKVENLSKAIAWTFPKGHPEKDESDTQAALREVLEETGWQCRVVKPLLDVEYVYVHEGVKTQKTVRWFLMEPIKKTGDFHQGEILDCQWVKIEEARGRASYESDQKLLARLGSGT